VKNRRKPSLSNDWSALRKKSGHSSTQVEIGPTFAGSGMAVLGGRDVEEISGNILPPRHPSRKLVDYGTLSENRQARLGNIAS
jgi:hypothetical protein